jgi:hypothetical protein
VVPRSHQKKLPEIGVKNMSNVLNEPKGENENCPLERQQEEGGEQQPSGSAVHRPCFPVSRESRLLPRREEAEGEVGGWRKGHTGHTLKGDHQPWGW